MKKSKHIIADVLLLLALMAGCAPAPSPSPDAPSATPGCAEDGLVRRERVESPTLGWPIDVEYYLPPCYEEHTWASYPVLYLIPGRGSGASTWNSAGRAAEVANGMIRSGEVPPFILVTTANYASDTQGAALINELIPYVDDRFRTLPDRRHRAVGGASLGGVIAYRMAFQHPHLFGSLGVFGSGVVRGDEKNVATWLAATPADYRWPRILIDIGDEDTIILEARIMTGTLDEWGIPYTFNIEPGDHSYTYWSSNLEMYYRWYAEDW